MGYDTFFNRLWNVSCAYIRGFGLCSSGSSYDLRVVYAFHVLALLHDEYENIFMDDRS
jgi:hypothetical protein